MNDSCVSVRDREHARHTRREQGRESVCVLEWEMDGEEWKRGIRPKQRKHLVLLNRLKRNKRTVNTHIIWHYLWISCLLSNVILIIRSLIICQNTRTHNIVPANADYSENDNDDFFDGNRRYFVARTHHHTAACYRWYDTSLQTKRKKITMQQTRQTKPNNGLKNQNEI